MSDAGPLPYQSNQPPVPPSGVTCPKCRSRMVQGVAVTLDGRGSGRGVWVAGLIRRGWFGQTVLPKGRRYELIAYRCPACGFVEHYCPPG